jgi:hypothetical protein
VVFLSSQPLPDISEWSYAGTTQLGNTPAHMWQLMRRAQQKVSSYTFYTSPEGAPLRLYMMGYNIMAGSHFGEGAAGRRVRGGGSWAWRGGGGGGVSAGACWWGWGVEAGVLGGVEESADCLCVPLHRAAPLC